MILLDTHIWVWWTHGVDRLSDAQKRIVEANEIDTIGVSAISCWEIAKLVERGRLDLDCDLDEWFAKAMSYDGVRLLELTPQIAALSTRLPQPFHNDPADQVIVATAMIHRCRLVTSDQKLIAYAHVDTVG